MDKVDLSIAVVNRNTGPLLRACLSSIQHTIQSSGLAVEVIVVDNASTDNSAQQLEADFAGVRTIRNSRNVGFARANNQAFVMATGRHLLMLNPDTEVLGNALQAMVAFLDQHPAAGALGCRLLNPDGTLQVSCGHFPSLANMIPEGLGISRLFPRAPLWRHFKMTYWRHDEVRQVDQPSGACLMIRGSAWQAVGPLDERYFMYFEEVDLCYRLKQSGWSIWFLPDAQVIHYGGRSSAQDLDVRIVARYRSLLRFFGKHRPPWQGTILRIVTLIEMLWKTVVFGVTGVLRVQLRARCWEQIKRYLQVMCLCLQKQV